ncbi:ATP-binding protein [Crossiella cryophila]|uniref:DNA-binding CsgD family transcriptional regulator/tetratricopeptide (TPR) repeat protein n=1 Tax=Crossiella cryophila TaxID=43355 RepID=A0A7W7CFD9_9PSEU|nr:AAA family ATPase [Crossiella cryophila]MBB4680159.1 DNA-binding CsgD family transcriptional regulator/tetratricopeptide (TPR) repeat protein [Crossiella cryophila]
MNGGRDTALVGRDRELDLLVEIAEKARAGTGQAVLLRGPAGIGKTTLLQAALTRIRPLAARTLSARCRDAGSGAYAAVRALFEPLHLTQKGEAGRLLDGSARHALPAVDPEIQHPTQHNTAYSVLHGLHWLTVGLTADGLLVLAVDDLQWCDDPSLRWLAFLLRRAEDLPLLLLLTQRTDQDSPVTEVFAEIAELSLCHTVNLPALSARPVAELLTKVLGAEPELAFAARCAQLTGGNPLLLGRMLTRLGEHDGDRTDPALLEDLGRAVVARSVLDRLPEHFLAVARAIAILPGEALELIAALAGAHHRTTTAAISELRRRDLVTAEDFGPGPEFVHDTIRQTVLGGTPSAELDQLRERAATLLNDAGRPAEEVAVLLVLLPGAPEPWMADVLREAATGAEHRGAPRMAASYLERVLAVDDADVPVLSQLARVLAMIEPTTALRHLERALELIADPRRQVPLVLQYTLTSLRAQNSIRAFALACTTLDALTKTIGPEPDSTDRALRAVLESSMLASGIDEKTNLGELGERFAHRANPPGDTAEERQLLAGLALLGMLQARPAAELAEQTRRALKINEVEVGGWTILGSIYTLYLADDTVAMPEALDMLVEHMQSTGAAWTYCLVSSLRAIVRHWNGDLVEALADAQSCYDLVVQENWAGAMVMPQVALAVVLTDLGEADRADEILGETFRDRFDAFTLEYHYYLMARARTYEALGEIDRALETLQQCALSLAEGNIDNPVLAPWWYEAALILADQDRLEEGTAIANHGAELCRRWGTPRALGMALTAQGAVTPGPQGIRLLTEAVRTLATSPGKFEHARAEYLLGRALLRAGDAEAARKRLRSSLDRSVLLRHRRQVTLSSAALLEAGGRLRRGTDSPADSLTGSERRVAARAANGATNREIAESLFLTVRTVELHLTSAYRKLGVRGRAELAAALARSGQ